MKIDWTAFGDAVDAQLGKPYGFGAKWAQKDPDPSGPIDCSGFVRWAFSRVGLEIPDGSSNQFDASVPLDRGQAPQLGDLGFFKHHADKGGDVHHVGIWRDPKYVIEARGEPYNAVIIRPVQRWEAWSEFTGWRRLKAVMDAEV